MKIPNEIRPYLLGQNYTNSLAVEYKIDLHDYFYLTKAALLSELALSKKIVHIGFADHNISTIQKKLSKGKWLHANLVAAATECLGIDINKEAVEYTKMIGFNNVECINIFEVDSVFLPKNAWDYVFLPDVLEHQDNPVSFLRTLKERCCKHAKEIVITVPNAFAHEIRAYNKASIEIINSDHRYWFTPYTLAKVMLMAGIECHTIRMTRSGTIKPWQPVRNLMYSFRPLERNTIVALGSF